MDAQPRGSGALQGRAARDPRLLSRPWRFPESQVGPTLAPALGSARRLRLQRASESERSEGGRLGGRAAGGGGGEGTALWAGRQVGRRRW